ncbi:MAG: hypothetical protein WKG32_07530 [Gemmatimonadaceae bacterium]
MSAPHRVGELEIDQDLARERRGWRIERGGWLVMLGAVLAALLGAFGRGPLSHAAVGGDAGLRLEYERVARARAPTTLRMHVSQATLDGGALHGDTLVVWLDRTYVEHAEVVRMVPAPDRVTASEDRVLYRVGVTPGGRGATVTFDLEPERFGRITGRAGLVGGPSHEFRQFIYP